MAASSNSSTIVLRDNRQRVFGALCINIDVTEIRHAAYAQRPLR